MQTQLNELPQVILQYSPLQVEFLREVHEDPNLDHRYCGKIGATRSGKTTLDVREVIQKRIDIRRKKQGLVAITGVSLGTIGRNILEPMRDYWASLGFPKVVGETHKDREGNTFCKIFGQKVYLVGMGDKKAIARLRGAEFKYVYCDELAECSEEAFELLKSRLSLSYSCCDFTCNPDSDTHWLYKFINSDIDIYIQNYTIFDNPFLARKVVRALCQEYRGTIFYKRYILGLWVRAEGCIYKQVADNPECYVLDDKDIPPLAFINIGVDFGGNKSKHSFTATGFSHYYKNVIVLESYRVQTNLTPDKLEAEFVAFVNRVRNKYKATIKEVRLDSAEQVLIAGFRAASQRARLPITCTNAIKGQIRGRIDLVLRLIGAGRIWWTKNSTTSLEAYKSAVWSDKLDSEGKNIRLDDGSIDVDSLDSTEYSLEPEKNILIKTLGGGK